MKKNNFIIVFSFITQILLCQIPTDFRDPFCGIYESYFGNCSINIPPNDPYGVGQTLYIRVDKSTTSLDSIIILDSSLYYDSHFVSYAKLNIDSTWQSDNLYFGDFKKTDTLQRTYVVFPGPVLCYKFAKKISSIGFYSLNKKEKEWYLFPNPASNELSIILPGLKEELSLLLLDINGKLLMEQQFIASTRLAVGALPRGVYVLKIQGKDINLSKRLVLVE